MEDKVLEFAAQKRLIADLEYQLRDAKCKLEHIEKEMAKEAWKNMHGRAWSFEFNDLPLLW
jgi:hypothetical protein